MLKVMGCLFLIHLGPWTTEGEARTHAQSLQSCPTLCNPMDHSPPGSSVQGILQARILEWVAMPFSRWSSQPRDQTCFSCIAGRFFTAELTPKARVWPLSGVFHPQHLFVTLTPCQGGSEVLTAYPHHICPNNTKLGASRGQKCTWFLHHCVSNAQPRAWHSGFIIMFLGWIDGWMEELCN